MRPPTLLTLLWVMVLTADHSQLSAQEAADRSCDVPVVISRFVASSRTVELVKDLGLTDFNVKIGGMPGTVEAATVDGGGKRIALILDASGKVPKDEWKLETEMAVSLVEHARPDDEFMLLLAGKEGPPATLMAPRELLERLKALASSRPDADPSDRIYDALLIAAKSLEPPQFGDTIFLFGHPDDSGSKASAEQVEELILRSRLRFYAMSFTDPLRDEFLLGPDPNGLPVNVGQQNADRISHATGYFFSYHSVESLSIPGQISLLKGFLGDLYAGIAEPYRLKIKANVSGKIGLDLVLTNGEARNIHQRDMHYPHFIYQCIAR